MLRAVLEDAQLLSFRGKGWWRSSSRMQSAASGKGDRVSELPGRSDHNWGVSTSYLSNIFPGELGKTAQNAQNPLNLFVSDQPSSGLEEYSSKLKQ